MGKRQKRRERAEKIVDALVEGMMRANFGRDLDEMRRQKRWEAPLASYEYMYREKAHDTLKALYLVLESVWDDGWKTGRREGKRIDNPWSPA